MIIQSSATRRSRPAVTPGGGITLFQLDVSAGGLGQSGPWTLKNPYSTSNLFGMMYAPLDIYTVTTFAGALPGGSGNAFRLNFAGRNGVCNTCGSVDHTITSGEVSSEVLAQAGDPWQGYIYNKSRGWTRWNSTYDATTVSFSPDIASPTHNSTIGDNSVVANDIIQIPKQCGVNGTIGGNINRRSDCDLAINYMQGISADDFPYGGVFAKRFYFYVPTATVLPDTDIKISGYTNFSGGGQSIIRYNCANGELEATGTNSNPPFPYTQLGVFVTKDAWMYVEEVFQRESGLGAGDGTHTVYCGVRGAGGNSTPVLTRTGLTLGNVNTGGNGCSFIGNWQHLNDASGYIWFDGVKYSTAYLGDTY